MMTVLLIFHVMIALGLIGFVLMQHGKGADAGAAFGSGSSATVFGARGAANFLSRTTAILAALFFVTSLAMAYLVGGNEPASSVTDVAPVTSDVPPAESEQRPADVPTVNE